MNAPDEDTMLVERYLDRDLSPEETGRLFDAIGRDRRTAHALIARMMQIEILTQTLSESIETIKEHEGNARRSAVGRRRLIFWAAAALVLLALGIWMGNPWGDPDLVRGFSGSLEISGNRIRAAEGQAGEVALADGSVVFVRGETSLDLDRDDTDGGMIVHMDRGMVGFDVTKATDGRPFKVNMRQGEIAVTGTIFDIASSPLVSTVTVYDGGLRIRNAHGEARIAAGAKSVIRMDSAPEVLPAGRIAFVSERDGNMEIYSMNPEGEDIRRLTDHPATDVAPSWSPDGRKIAFLSSRDGDMNVYVMDADGTHARRLTNASAIVYRPTWSPDACHIAFDKFENGQHAIFAITAAGSDQRSIATGGSDCDWSPDGMEIVFTRSDASSHPRIFRMNADGNRAREVTRGNEWAFQPSWSPDGRTIAYSRSSGASRQEPQIRSAGLSVIGSDGSSVRRLTDREDYTPDWSPDGSRIVFTSRARDGDAEIYLIDPASLSVRRITHSRGVDIQPSWGLEKPWFHR